MYLQFGVHGVVAWGGVEVCFVYDSFEVHVSAVFTIEKSSKLALVPRRLASVNNP